jgi:signal transduction histidine kinase
MFAPELDSAWVEVPAVLTGYETRDQRLTLSVEVHGLPFKAELPMTPDANDRADSLMLRPARLQGVMGTIFNRQRQMTDRHFFVPSLDFIAPDAEADQKIEPQPRQIAQLLTGDTGPRLRVRVTGTISQLTAGGFYLRDDSGSTLVQAGGSAMDGSLVPGLEIAVDGYAAVAPFRPVLRAAHIQPTGRRHDVALVPLDPSATDLLPLHAERVSLSADFLGSHHGGKETILQFQANGRFFEALLPAGAAPAKPELRTGDRIRLIGICELTTTHPLPRPVWVDGFRIHLPETGGLTTLRRAPWWTPNRLFAALAITTGAAALGFLLSWMLRRQVIRQMAVISGKLRSETIGEERDRMARELHDTLDQQLSGVALQLDSLHDAVRENPASALETLSLARRMLRYTRTEARRSVWDLRSRVLQKDGLVAALRGLADAANAKAGPRVEVRVSGIAGPLPPRVDFHFLRISQEAVTNAIKHSKASSITILLEHDASHASLSIQDDGSGFDPSATASSDPEPHFGLLGMRERAARIGATLEITSSPGHGCTVRVTKMIEPHAPQAL